MANTNFINSSSVTHNYSSGDSNPTYSHDDNYSTAMSYLLGPISEGGTCVHTAYSEHIFPTARTILQWKFRVNTYTLATGPGASAQGWHQVEYKVSGGSYIVLPGSSYSYSGGQDSGHDHDSGTVTIDTTILNVTSVKVTAYAQANCYDGWRSIQTYIYEIQAFGNAYVDSGIRVKGASVTYSIGMETLTGSHKLRFNKGGTIYGIPLLSTSDLDATPIRIYDGSLVKALPKAT